MAERWNVGVVGAIGAVAGGVSAAAASLLGGGDAFIGGTAVGVGAGAVIAGALCWALREHGEALSGEPSAPPRAEPVVPMAALPTADNLAPLIRAMGDRFGELAQRQLDAIDGLGRAVRGPAPEDLRVAERLARRTRRMANSLVILADPDAAAPARSPHTVTALLDAALSDSDHAARIDSSSVHDAVVRGEYVEDIAHLLAELIDNAAASSDDLVIVVGRRNASGYVMSVVDEGAGLNEGARDEANRSLRNPPGLDRQSPARLGLSVVGRLAARHGISVQLLEGATDGVIAKVRLPHGLLEGGPDALTSPFERAFDALEASRLLVEGDATIELDFDDNELIDLTEELEPAPAFTATTTTSAADDAADGDDGGADAAGDDERSDDPWPAALAAGITDTDRDADADQETDDSSGAHDLLDDEHAMEDGDAVAAAPIKASMLGERSSSPRGRRR